MLASACGGSGDSPEAQGTTAAKSDEASTEEASTELSQETVEVDGGTVVVVRTAGVTAEPTVLFLHGAAFTSQTWVQNGILAKVSEAGINGIAIDLPGFGNSSRSGSDDGEFLVSLFSTLNLDPSTTVIVSPSMSGGFSLPALRDPFFANLGGYVPVAPVGAGSFVDAGPPLETPALVIWGDGDGGDPKSAAESLASGFVTSTVLILPDAGHAAYQQQPELFTEALVDFVGQVIS